MDSDDPMPSIERETLPYLPHQEASTNSEIAFHANREDASSIPLPPSSPAIPSQLTPRLRMDASAQQAQSPVQRPPTSRPLNPDRRSSTPLHLSRRSVASSYTANPNTPPRAVTSRRSSSNLLRSSSASTTRSRSPAGAIKEMERKPVITAASVARDCFKRDLAVHDGAESTSKTVVILRDSCYGHRYSRPRTSKAALSTIVERPERLHACIVGASAAYVRIGGRHAGGKFPPHPSQDVRSPPFKIRKTTRSTPLNYSAVTQVHGQKWMEELQIMCDSAEGKLAMNGRELVRPIGYGKDEAGNPLPKLHEGDLYLCSESLDALQGCLGGVCEAVDTVFGPNHTSRAFVCIRPPGHHCSSNFPSGFCWLNNVHVGIAHAAMNQGLTHAAIIDFDLHHGDGSQAIAWEHNTKAAGTLPKNASAYSKTPIGYFSLHDINSYPCEWGDEEKIKNASLCVENAHGQSIWNVHLEPWKNHTDFWKLYESRYSILLEKTRTFLRLHTKRLENANNGTKAKAAIFLSAGFDASEWEGAGMQRHKVNVPTDFYARFTSDIVRVADEEGLGVDGRIISVLEGGYSDRALTSGVLSHLCGLTSDSGHTSVDTDVLDTGLASAMAKKMNILDTNNQTQYKNGNKFVSEPDSATETSYNSEWWTTTHLEALETLTNPVPPPSVPAKLKDKNGNYSSPTQASTAKMTDPARERRSLSGQADFRASMEPEPVLPPPDVSWAVASYELSRLLIPTDRQTLSCRHDKLNAEATKVRRERQSGIGLPSDDLLRADQRMQLRDRRAKAPVADEALHGASKADRRRTIAAVGDLPDPESLGNLDNNSGVSIANTRLRRRSSAGSSILSAFESMNLNGHGDQPPEAGVVTGRGETTVSQARARTLALPAKGDKVPVQKRVKQPTAAKVPPVKAKASPRKTGSTPPVPKVPPMFRKTSSHASIDGKATTISQTQSACELTDSASSVTNIEEVDALSSGMKKMKINLKVPTPEENLARERKKAEEKDKLKKARAPRKPAVPKAPKTGVVKVARQSHSARGTSTSTPETPNADDRNATTVDIISQIAQTEQQPTFIQSITQSAPAGDYVPTPDIAHAEPPPQATIPAPVPAPAEMQPISSHDGAVEESEKSTSNGPEIKFAYTMPQHPSSPSPPRQSCLDSSEPLAFAAPASAPPTANKRTRADLPQFTASSPIPFARMDANSFDRFPNPETSLDSSIANLESVPGPSEGTTEAGSDFHPHLQQNVRTSATENTPPLVQQQQRQHPPNSSVNSAAALDPSIWEVPETPRH